MAEKENARGKDEDIIFKSMFQGVLKKREEIQSFGCKEERRDSVPENKR